MIYQPLFNEKDLDELTANMDYSLIVSSGSPISSDEEEQLATIRKQQLQKRIKIRQNSSRLLLHFLSGDMTSSESTLQHLLNIVLGKSNEEFPVYIQWDQSIQTDYSSQAESVVWCALQPLITFLIVYFRMQSSNVGTLNPSILADGTDFIAVLSHALTSIDSLRPMMAHPPSPAMDNNTSLVASLLSIRLLFSPQWLKAMTFLCSTLVTWLPLMLQFILKQRWTINHSAKTLQLLSTSNNLYPTIMALLSTKPNDLSNGSVALVDPLIDLTQRWQSTESNKGLIASDALLLVVDKFLHLLGWYFFFVFFSIINNTHINSYFSGYQEQPPSFVG